MRIDIGKGDAVIAVGDIFGGGHAQLFMEDAGEIQRIIEAGGKRDFADQEVFPRHLGEKLAGIGEAADDEIFAGRLADIFAEDLAQVIDGEAEAGKALGNIEIGIGEVGIEYMAHFSGEGIAIVLDELQAVEIQQFDIFCHDFVVAQGQALIFQIDLRKEAVNRHVGRIIDEHHGRYIFGLIGGMDICIGAEIVDAAPVMIFCVRHIGRDEDILALLYIQCAIIYMDAADSFAVIENFVGGVAVHGKIDPAPDQFIDMEKIAHNNYLA